ncbi:MAG: undecaprenyl-diphosphate phosphatase [Thiohalobacterales bacterium]|nr:undecaprenyl-diphosphate phosphatase [Thiohalobacterales bacterium]
MDWLQVVALAVIQGITEFLPISSSAHLVFPGILLGWPDQGLAFDVAVHVGTLSAVLLYYRTDLARMLAAWLASLGGGTGGGDEDSRMVWYLLLATIPAGLAGLYGGDFIEANLRSLPVIASTTVAFGVLLWFADRAAPQPGGGRAMSLAVALGVGVAQALAPVPGVSRSGVTITAGLFLGLDRQTAARFSFLLSIPIIASAGALMIFELLAAPGVVDWPALVAAVLLSGLTAFLCIAAFLRVLDRVGLVPFVVYRLVLGGLLFYLWAA